MVDVLKFLLGDSSHLLILKKKGESPYDILAKTYYTDLRDFVRLNHELYRKANQQRTYKFSKMYNATGKKDITCTPLDIRENRLTFTFAQKSYFLMQNFAS